jgi:uncharacterized protein
LIAKTFVVPLADLERGPKQVVWSLERGWLDLALEQTEAVSRGRGTVDVTLCKDGRQVIVKGRVKAPLTMPCARTLDPVEIDVDAELLLMLSPAPSREPPTKISKKRNPPSRGQVDLKVQARAVGRLAKDRALSEEDVAQDFYFGDEIVLDAFVREFILLELPMFPLRSDLRAIDNPAIPGPPDQAPVGAGSRIDPRLAPLAEIAGRLKCDTKE